jgi:sulfur transfer complex TusBCD TusB component (DsrH family)
VDDHGLVPGSDGGLAHASPAATEEDADFDSVAVLLEAGQSITVLEEGVAHALLDAAASDSLAMYPCLEVPSVRGHLDFLLGLANHSPQQAASALRLIDIEILKVVLLVGASSNASPAISDNDVVARMLQSSIAWTVESTLLHDVVSVEDVILSCLMVRPPTYLPRSCKSCKSC